MCAYGLHPRHLGTSEFFPLRLSGEDWKRLSVCSADQAILGDRPVSLLQHSPANLGGLGRLEQFRRQIRVCLTRHQLRVVPGFRHLGEQFILLRLLQKLGGVPQAGLAAGRQEGLISDKLCLTPGQLFLGKLTGKLIDLSQASVLQSLVDGIPQGGDQAVHTVEGAFVH